MITLYDKQESIKLANLIFLKRIAILGLARSVGVGVRHFRVLCLPTYQKAGKDILPWFS